MHCCAASNLLAAGLRSNFLCDIPVPPSLQNTPPCFAAPWWAAAAMLDVYLPGCPEGLPIGF